MNRHVHKTAKLHLPPPPLHREDLLRRIRGEYREMPGLSLTLPQAERMWNLHQSECARLLRDLVATGFLSCTPLGTFVRADSGSAGA